VWTSLPITGDCVKEGGGELHLIIIARPSFVEGMRGQASPCIVAGQQWSPNNAGPSRPRLWRSSLEKTVEGAIFAETIPFSETRGYVKSVLANATWYAALFENKPQSLKARLGQVSPKDASLSELGDLP